MLRLIDTGLPINSRNLRTHGIEKKVVDYVVTRLRNRRLIRETGYKLTSDGHKALGQMAKDTANETMSA